MVVVEAPQTRRFGRIEQHFQVPRAHRIAVVRKTPRIKPGHDALRIVDGSDSPLRLLRDHLLEKIRTQRTFKVQHIIVETRQYYTEHSLHDFERIGNRETGVPLDQGLRIAIYRTNEAIEATVEEVVLGQ